MQSLHGPNGQKPPSRLKHSRLGGALVVVVGVVVVVVVVVVVMHSPLLHIWPLVQEELTTVIVDVQIFPLEVDCCGVHWNVVQLGVVHRSPDYKKI
jgi:hypothetical protein